MEETPLPEEHQRTLRFLKILVTTLTVTMIAGLITIIALFVIRFPAADVEPGLAMPPGIELPAGEKVSAVTQGKGWVAIVTDSGKILVYDGRTGVLRHSYMLGN